MKTFRALLIVASLAMGPLSGLADELKPASKPAKPIKGTALCLKCALGKSDACQDAFQYTDAKGKKRTVTIAATDASKGFHKNICSGAKPAWAIGKIKDGQLTAKKLGLQKKVSLEGELSCAKCGLGKAKSCQNAIQVKKDGRKVTYFLDQNDVSKKFHATVCSDTVKGKVAGAAAQINGQWQLLATKITAE